MPSLRMGGFDIEGCIPCLLVLVGIILGGWIAYQGALASDGAVMVVGLAIVLGVITLAGKGYVKFDL